jgi:hypothetical protein
MNEFIAAEAIAEDEIGVVRIHFDLVVACTRVDIGVSGSEQLDEIPIVAAVDRNRASNSLSVKMMSKPSLP